MTKARETRKHLVTDGEGVGGEGAGLRRLALRASQRAQRVGGWEDEKRHKPICPGFRSSQVSTSQPKTEKERALNSPKRAPEVIYFQQAGKENVFVEDIRRD